MKNKIEFKYENFGSTDLDYVYKLNKFVEELSILKGKSVHIIACESEDVKLIDKYVEIITIPKGHAIAQIELESDKEYKIYIERK